MGRIFPSYNKDFFGSTHPEKCSENACRNPMEIQNETLKNKNKTAAQLKRVISPHKGNLWKNISFAVIG